MNLAAEIPLLAGLPKVELARLLGDLEELSLPAEAIVLSGEGFQDWLYFVLEGEVEVSLLHKPKVVPLCILGPGEVFGESSLLTRPRSGESVRTITPVRVARIPAKRMQRLMHSDPTLARAITEIISERLSVTREELVRVKGMLSAYMDEVWSSVPSPPVVDAISALSPSVRAAAPPPSAPAAPKRSWRLKLGGQLSFRLFGIAGSTAGAFMVYQLLSATPQLATATAILLWAAANWLLGTMPDYVTALATCAFAVLMGVAAPSVSFAGFANPSWFLLLGVLGIGAAVSKSGLLYRIALHMLKLLPQTYLGQSLAMALTGLLFTPLLPSANSRSAIASPLARELSEAMRFPALGKGSAGLAMSSFLGFGQMYFVFLNGTNICLLAWSLLPPAVRQQVTWGTWLWWALPLGLLTFIGSYLAIVLMYKPEPTTGVSRKTISAQLRILGPLAGSERTTATVLGLVLLGFITQGWHGVDPAWVSLGGFLLLVTLGVVDKNAMKTIDWGFLLLVGGLVSLSDVTKATGLTVRLTEWIGPILEPLGASPYLFIGAVALLMLLARLAVPIQQAVLVMVMSLLPVANQMGFHPFVITVVVLAMSNSWILPQQNSMYLTVYSGTDERSFTHKQVRPLALVQSAVGILAVLASVPFWQALGLIPR